MRLRAIVLAAIAGCASTGPQPRNDTTPAPTVARPTGDPWVAIATAAADLEPAAPATGLPDDLAAWSAAGGGLPWRGDRSPRGAHADQLLPFVAHVRQLLSSRPRDPEALRVVLYAARRLRREGSCLFDVATGFAIASEALVASPELVRGMPDLAPVDAELHRALAVHALCTKYLIDASWETSIRETEALIRAKKLGTDEMRDSIAEHHSSAELKIRTTDATIRLALPPPERHDVAKHVYAIVESSGAYWPVALLHGSLGAQVDTMVDILDAFTS